MTPETTNKAKDTDGKEKLKQRNWGGGTLNKRSPNHSTTSLSRADSPDLDPEIKLVAPCLTNTQGLHIDSEPGPPAQFSRLLNRLLLLYTPNPSTSPSLPPPTSLAPATVAHYQGNEAQTPGLGGWHHHQVHAKKEVEKSRPTPAKLSARHHRYSLCSKEAGTRWTAPAAAARTHP